MKGIIFVGLIGGLLVLAALSGQFQLWQQPRFANDQGAYETSASELWQILKQYATVKRHDVAPAEPTPIVPITPAELQHQQDRLYRLGHSTVLMQLDGQWLLTDPVFSDRASPLQSMGPKRFQPAPISIEQLPPLAAVLISHDHYDHLDQASINQLADRVPRFIVPTGVGAYLIDWGVAPDKITELAWWQQAKIDAINITATPAQHFSGRGLVRDRTLWCSYVIATEQHKLFFSGDSGYFDGFKQIGERLGPFDLTLMELGAYNELWSTIHMMPSESVQAHRDLGGKVLVPIHNSTFDLALHPWYEPLREANRIAQQSGQRLVSPKFGQPVPLHSASTTPSWIP